MSSTQSGKKKFRKTFKFCKSIGFANNFVVGFKSFLKSYRHDRTQIAIDYTNGLFITPKDEANIERMEEVIEGSRYRAYQQFIRYSHLTLILNCLKRKEVEGEAPKIFKPILVR